MVVVAKLETPDTVRFAPSCALPEMFALPTTVSWELGLLLPMPTLPKAVTVNKDVPELEAMVNKLTGEPVDWTTNSEAGALVPTPILFPEINNNDCGLTE